MIARLCFLFLTTAIARAGGALKWEQLPPIPEPLGVAGAFAGVSQNALLVAGGANFPDKKPWEGGTKVWHDRIWLLDRTNGEWREAGKLPHPLAYGVSVSTNGCTLCIGGCDAVRHYPDVIRLVWRDGQVLCNAGIVPAPLPVPLAYGAGAADEAENVYVACGATEPGERKASNRVFQARWRAKENQWLELPALPAEPRILPVAAAHRGAFYLFGGAALETTGGKTSRRYLRDAWCYSPNHGWKRLSDMPRACAAAASPAPVVEGRFLLLAGDDGSLTGYAPIEKHPGFPAHAMAYDPATDRWSVTGKVPAPRVTLPCAKWLGRFILPSGEVRPGVRSPDVWMLSPDNL